MNRRRFLTLTGLAVGAATHASGTHASGTPSRTSEGRESELQAAIEGAQRACKPFVLIPVPRGTAEQKAVQAVWGALFSSPKNEHLSLLALCEFGFGALPEDGSEDGVSGCALIRLPGENSWTPVRGASAIPRDAEAIHAALKACLCEDGRIRRSLVSHAGSRRGVVDQHALHMAGPESAPRLKIAAADDGAAILYALIEESEDEAYRQWGHSVLATAAALRLFEASPVGADWVETWPEVDPCPACGMAIVPKTSKLFLDAYTR